jgi:hypothetical protein
MKARKDEARDNRKWLSLFAVLSQVFLLGGCEEGKSAPPPPVPEVAVMAIHPQPVVLTSELPGRTSPYLVAEIRPQVSGLIQNRLFTEGSDVKAGQVLYEIDPAPFQAALESARANLDATRKAAERARAALQATIAGVARHRATLDLAALRGAVLGKGGLRQPAGPGGNGRTGGGGDAAGGRGPGGKRSASSGRGRGGHKAGRGRLSDGPHQPWLHPDHRSHLWAASASPM